MKNLLLITLLCLMFAACKVPVYDLGMTEREFTAHDKILTMVVEKSAERSVYKRLADANGKYMFYYFTDGKLTRIDEGERKPDLIIVHQ